jgi:hypothetical protein
LAFFCYVRNGGFFAVLGKTRILLGKPDTPIEKKSKMIDALVQKTQLDEHEFRYYVMFATMDMLICRGHGAPTIMTFFFRSALVLWKFGGNGDLVMVLK